jgi:hypothetical protein
MKRKRAIDAVRFKKFKTYRRLLALLMLLATTLGPIAHAQTNEIIYPIVLEDAAESGHLHNHGHANDIDHPKDRTFNHSYDHNLADHSHDVPGISIILSKTLPNSFNDRQSISTTSLVDHLSFSIDRPSRI